MHRVQREEQGRKPFRSGKPLRRGLRRGGCARSAFQQAAQDQRKQHGRGWRGGAA
jgi:hypothetical protein